MATVKISQLTAAAAATGTQELEVNESGTSKKITGAQLATYIEGEVSSSPVLTGQVSLDDGTATAPSLTNTGDTNTGIYFPNADEVGIATGGTLRVSVNSDGSLVTTGGTVSLPSITTTGDTNTGIFFPAADTIAFTEGGTETFRFGSSGQLGVAGANYGTSGQVLTSGGASAAPSWTDVSGSPTGTVTSYAGLTEPSGWLFCYGQSVSRTTYATLFAALSKNSIVTITIASPGVITWTAHGLAAGDPVTFNTTGALPTGITAGTTYYVIAAGLATNSFQISTSVGGAAVNTSGSQSGTHTAYYVPYGVASSTNFNIPDLRGRATAGRDNMGGTSANRLTNQSGGLDGDILGAAGGAETHTLSTGELASHTHTQASNTALNTSGSFWSSTSANRGSSGGTTNSSGSSSAHNNVQPTFILNYIIKT